MPTESNIPATALQSPPCGRDVLCPWTDSRGARRCDVSRGERHQSNSEHLCFESDQRLGLWSAVSTVRLFCAGHLVSHGSDESRLLAREPERAGLEIAAHAGLCCLR